MTMEITDSSFYSEVIDSKIPVIVDFWAPWCGPCQSMAPIIDELATELDGTVKVAKMNIDDNPIGAGKLGIMSIPTIILFKDGEIKARHVGLASKQKLIDWIKENS